LVCIKKKKLPVLHKKIVHIFNVFLLKDLHSNCGILLVVMNMLISNIGKLIDESPYKNEYVMMYMEVSRNTLSNWRTGKSFPSVPKLYKLSRLLGVTIEELYEYIENK